MASFALGYLAGLSRTSATERVGKSCAKLQLKMMIQNVPLLYIEEMRGHCGMGCVCVCIIVIVRAGIMVSLS